jgi:hypothetical protein
MGWRRLRWVLGTSMRRGRSWRVFPVSGTSLLFASITAVTAVFLFSFVARSFDPIFSNFFLLLANLDILSTTTVKYVTLPGWKTPITHIRTYEELPENCRKYVEFIEGYLKVPVEWIGTGPGREDMVAKKVK